MRDSKRRRDPRSQPERSIFPLSHSSRQSAATKPVIVGGISAAVAVVALFVVKVPPGDASGSAVSSMRAIAAVNEQYRESHGEYAQDLHALRSANLIDYVLANGTKGGYMFRYQREKRPDGTEGWACNAKPMTSDYGDVHLFVDETGVVRYEKNRIAHEGSPSVD